MSFCDRVVEYMRLKGYEVFSGPMEFNIVYVEGVDGGGLVNDDRLGGWNDRRLLIVWKGGKPSILVNAQATTEPGVLNSPSASRKNGVFHLPRIDFGQYSAWRFGWHKQSVDHPALVQVLPLPITRDTNLSGGRSKSDLRQSGIFGLNQHTTSRGYKVGPVGNQSLGCLVGMRRTEHSLFLDYLKSDRRYVADPAFVFTTTLISGTDLERVLPFRRK